MTITEAIGWCAENYANIHFLSGDQSPVWLTNSARTVDVEAQNLVRAVELAKLQIELAESGN